MKNVPTYRMYGFVPYNISEIQKGIQFGHAVVEYGLKYSESVEYDKWAREDKTFIILNGGTTNDNKESKWYGSLNQLRDGLRDLRIKHAEFLEPDLGEQLTAIVFLVEDRVWDYATYPDYAEYVYKFQKESDADKLVLSLPMPEADYYAEIWGEDWGDVLNFRLFLKGKKLA